MQGILESVPLSGWKKHMNWLKFGQDSFITQYVFKHLHCSTGTKNKKHKTQNTKQNKKDYTSILLYSQVHLILQ